MLRWWFSSAKQEKAQPPRQLQRGLPEPLLLEHFYFGIPLFTSLSVSFSLSCHFFVSGASVQAASLGKTASQHSHPEKVLISGVLDEPNNDGVCWEPSSLKFFICTVFQERTGWSLWREIWERFLNLMAFMQVWDFWELTRSSPNLTWFWNGLKIWWF